VSFVHNVGESQTRLLIENIGILGYRDKRIDFFTDNPDEIAEARTIIEKGKGVTYIGEFDLPREIVFKVITAGKSMNQARGKFEEISQTLIDKLNE